MNILFRDGTTLNVQAPATMIGVIVGLIIAIVTLMGCSNPVGVEDDFDEDLCDVIETGDVYAGASNHQTGIWYGVAVPSDTQAQIGDYLSVLQDGQGMHRFHIDWIDADFLAPDYTFLIDNTSTARVPETWVSPTYELVRCPE